MTCMASRGMTLTGVQTVSQELTRAKTNCRLPSCFVRERAVDREMNNPDTQSNTDGLSGLT